MSVQEKIVADETSVETAAPVTSGPASAKGSTGAMLAGAGDFTETGVGKAALIGSKVLLFNVLVWGPVAALGYMIFFW
ncbi:MAG: hypothetical protein AAGI51_03035 [Pseudomonadota bacterium]